MTTTLHLDLDTYVARATGVLSTEVEDDLVLLHLESDDYFGMNPVSRRIWELFEQPVALSTVCDRITAEFDVEREVCEQDVLAFARSLIEAGLAHTVNGRNRTE